MRPLKTIAVAALLTIAWFSAALAQFQPTPGSKAFKPTYTVSVIGLLGSTTATDFLTVTGSATKPVGIVNAECSGIATAASTVDIVALKRSTVNLTGTSTTPAIVPSDPSSPAATAVARAYTVNPGTLGTLVGNIRAMKLALPVVATAAIMQRLQFLFGDGPYEQAVVLRSATQVFSLNANGTLPAGTALDCHITWTEG
jgi:hypothetical protein